jgi:hypothetical protein
MKVRFEGKNIIISEIRKKEAVLLTGMFNLDSFLDCIDEDSVDHILKIADASGVESISSAMTILSHEIASDSVFDNPELEIEAHVYGAA